MSNFSQENYYKILGITPDASDDEIKAAYRSLVRKYHPDVCGQNEVSEKKFKEISNAYEVLSDKEKKKNYDTLRGFYNYGKNKNADKASQTEAKKAYENADKSFKAQNESPNSDENKKSNEPKTSSYSSKDETQEKSTTSFSKVFSDIFTNLKKQQYSKEKSKKEAPKRGQDINFEITITISEALNGTTRTVNVLQSDVCPNCQGRKFVNGSKCSKCNGTGEHSEHKKLKVKIPAKIKHGSKIRIANEGNAGKFGGKNGDLYLNVKIEQNEYFRYEGLNVYCTIPVSPVEAVLGTTINISTVDGVVAMKVMPKTNSGQKYRLSAQGLKKGNKVGDMIVTINIEVPKDITQEEIELYERLRKISNHNLRENLFNVKE